MTPKDEEIKNPSLRADGTYTNCCSSWVTMGQIGGFDPQQVNYRCEQLHYPNSN
jgi:hypothetical protein